MKIIEDYNKSLQAIYDHVGFKESWVIYPIDDCTNMFWQLDDFSIHFAESKKELKNKSGKYYEQPIYTQRFYDKHIYEGELFTMVFVDTLADGMKTFSLFDNSKKINEIEQVA